MEMLTDEQAIKSLLLLRGTIGKNFYYGSDTLKAAIDKGIQALLDRIAEREDK